MLKLKNLQAMTRLPLNTSYHNCTPQQQRIWNFALRWLVSDRDRYFFEGNRRIPGQLWVEERRLIDSVVAIHKPRLIFESGTWYGGGSTYFLTKALQKLGGGTLHTSELDPSLCNEALRGFKEYEPGLLEYVCFHCGASTEVFPRLLGSAKVDLLFLDGIGAEETLSEYQLFEPNLKAGSLLIAHDWNDVKTSRLRPHLQDDPTWRTLAALDPPGSLGMRVLIRD